MARIRTLKPEILEDEKTAGLSDAGFRLFTAMIVLADDYGNLRAEPRWLEGQIWWARGNPPRVAETLGEVISALLVEPYEVRGQAYCHIRSWEKHQRIDNAGKPRVPRPSDGSPISAAKFREIPLELAAGPRPPTSEKDPDQDHDQLPAKPAARGSRPKKTSEYTEAELASVRVVLDRLSERSGIRYQGSKEHTRLIVARLRDGCTEWDLRRVVGYCAERLKWEDKPEMRVYLRPETLFGPQTIAKYLDPARTAFPESAPTEQPIASSKVPAQDEPPDPFSTGLDPMEEPPWMSQ